MFPLTCVPIGCHSVVMIKNDWQTWQVGIEHPDTNATFVVCETSEIGARRAAMEDAAREIGPGAHVVWVAKVS